MLNRRRVVAVTLVVAVLVILTACASTNGIKPKEIKTEKAAIKESKESSIKQTKVKNVKTDLDQYSVPAGHIITLEEAIARAILHNREYKVKQLESVLELSRLDRIKYEMLPILLTRAGYEGRDKFYATSSRSISTGTQSLETSTSLDKNKSTGEITLSWNVLDFGLAYIRTDQQSDRSLIAKERERKVVHNIVMEVCTIYWHAVSADRLMKKIPVFMKEVEGALESSRIVEEKRFKTPIEALNYRRELLETLRALHTLRKDLVGAKVLLASLMGIKPGADFSLNEGDGRYWMPEIKWQVEDMERIAIAKRPELIEAGYQQHIAENEARALMLGLMPSISFNYGWKWDSNSYLLYDKWSEYGAQVSWNLLNVFKLSSTKDIAKNLKEIEKQRSNAVAIAVLMQVHIAKAQYQQILNELATAKDHLSVLQKIVEHKRNESAAGKIGKLELIRSELDLMVSELKRDIAYSEAQNTYNRLFVSMGMDLAHTEAKEYSVAELSKLINDRTKQMWILDLKKVAVE